MKSAGSRRVAITGAGVVSPLGCELETFWRRIAAGESAVAPIARFDATGFPTSIAAEVPGALVGAEVVPTHGGETVPADRITGFALHAAREAMRCAALDDGDGGRRRWGVTVAAGLGFYEHEEVFAACAAAARADGGGIDEAAFLRVAARSLLPRAGARRSPGNLAAALARRFSLGGPILAVDTACAAGAQALGDAARWIRRGTVDVVLAGAADSQIYPLGLASFCLLRALSRRNDEPARASRPFDATRDGFVLGEGAGMLVLEEWEHARARGAPILAEIVGFGSACDAYRATDPHPEGTGARLAMRRALADAGVEPGQVGYINAHGTSTPANDRIESRAIGDVFAGGPPPVSSTKSMIGHLTEAAGAVEAIVTALVLRHGFLPPTINHLHPDPECALDVVPGRGRWADPAFALSNSFGFGGQCASLLLARAPA